MTLEQLFNKRLILLSGKGGVGKTTVAVLLALLAARLKKNVLLVEMNSTERIAPYFGLSEIGPREIPLSPFISGINLNPHDCFEEYVLMQIRFKALFDTFINNRFVTTFLNAVPGLNDLLMIGKIYDFERKKKGVTKKDPLYDLIIVDGPATGHGVSSFEVPSIVSQAVHVGPLKKQSDNVDQLLRDPQKTVFCAVTTAEEMPVAETAELIKMVNHRLNILMGPIFLNDFNERILSDKDMESIEAQTPSKQDALFPYFMAAHLSYRRALLNEQYKSLLIEQNPKLNFVTIPHLDDFLPSINCLKPLVDGLKAECV